MRTIFSVAVVAGVLVAGSFAAGAQEGAPMPGGAGPDGARPGMGPTGPGMEQGLETGAAPATEGSPGAGQRPMGREMGMHGRKGHGMGHRAMGGGTMHGGMHGDMHGGMMGGMMSGGGPGGMRMMMILMDTDGDGALSLEEVQAVHERIFRAIDADGDGRATLEEIETFMHGGSGGNGPE